MNITRMTSRGLLVLQELAASDGPLTNPELADRLHISQQITEKVTNTLKHAGLVEGMQGRAPNVGYRLAEKVRKLPAPEAIQRLEGLLEAEKDDPPTTRAVKTHLRKAIIEALAELTVGDLVSGR